MKTRKRHAIVRPLVCMLAGTLALGFVPPATARATVEPVDLRCEYLKDPLGIDVAMPRLSWRIEDRSQKSEVRSQESEDRIVGRVPSPGARSGDRAYSGETQIQTAPTERRDYSIPSVPDTRHPTPGTRSVRQTAYQILVASSEKLLREGKTDLWDSGKVESDQSIQIEYAGAPLASRMECFWNVRVWTTSSPTPAPRPPTPETRNLTPAPSAWSAPARWTVGLLEPASWSAKWIGLDEDSSTKEVLPGAAQWIWFPEGEPAASAPAEKRFFRRSFELPAGRTIKAAVLKMTADNAFTAYVNGQQAGSGNDFHVTVTMDVTGMLKLGANVLAVMAENVGPGPTPAGWIANLRVEFAEGEPLLIHTDAQWKSSPSESAGWERPEFNDATWTGAKVLGALGMGPWGNLLPPQDARPLPARYLRREFTVEKKIRRATAYVCGLGFFDLYLNGRKVSGHVMDPALSDYRKAAYYVTFDVTEFLKKGSNAMGVMLGNGRFFAPRLTSPTGTVDYGFPKLLLQAEIQYQDGSTEVIASDEAWKVTEAGPIRANNEYDGEVYDARMEMPGWNAVGFNDSAWRPVQLVQAPGGVLAAQMIEPMRVTQVIKPVSVTNPKPGVFIVDMGQNFYGTVRMKARGPKGTEVRLTSAYSLLPDGTLKTADNRGAKATDVYIFKGEGEEVWNPQFKGQGYRRVQVTGFPGTPAVDHFEGLVIHTDTEPVGEFECSHELINKIHLAMRWGMRMFLRSAPMDPDRDERQAWMGDPAKDSESEAFNFNVAAFYTKWMDDVRRSQRPDGTIPEVAMNWDLGTRSFDWPSVYTIIPDWYVDFYADRRLSQKHYETAKRWVLVMDQHGRRPDGTLHGGLFGDWCDTYTMDGQCSESGKTDVALVHTAYHYNNCRIMARTAERLGKPEDVKLFNEMADRILAAFNKAFFDPATGRYGNGTQCSYVLPLAFGMVPAEHRAKVVENLVNDILVTHRGHLSVGLIGMQWMMQVLTDIGRPDVAWTIVTRTTRPSWGYMMSKGATTIWERWDTDTRDPGMNSEALLIQAGNLDAWFYQTLAGINYDKEKPGFKHIVIKPAMVGDLTWVKAHFDSPYGRIVSRWKREGEMLTLEVAVPPNTTATVYVPTRDSSLVTENGKNLDRAKGVKFLRMENGRAVLEAGSGNYLFSSMLEK